MKKHLSFRKIFFIIISTLLISSFFTGCASNKKSKEKQLFFGNAMSLVAVPYDFIVSEVHKETFSYDNIAISSYKYTGNSENMVITATTFPFSAEDYTEHYKSPYTDFSLEIQKTYEHKDIENPYIENCLFSEAYDKQNKIYHDVYILSFPEKTGCLVVYIQSRNKDCYAEYLENFRPVEKFSPIINEKEKNYSFKRYKLIKNISVELPKDANPYKISDKEYIFALKDGSFVFITISEENFLTNSKNSWRYTNGFEKYSDNFVYNINTNKLYYSSIDNRIISTDNEKYYIVSAECFMKGNNPDFATEILDTLAYGN